MSEAERSDVFKRVWLIVECALNQVDYSAKMIEIKWSHHGRKYHKGAIVDAVRTAAGQSLRLLRRAGVGRSDLTKICQPARSGEVVALKNILCIVRSYAGRLAQAPLTRGAGQIPDAATPSTPASSAHDLPAIHPDPSTPAGPRDAPVQDTPPDLIPLTWLRSVVPQKKVKGDATKLANWLKCRNVPIYKVAGKNHAERADLLRVFSARNKVHELIQDYKGDSE